jgi:hypothetical protein
VLQVPGAVTVIFKTTLPEALSEALGVYTVTAFDAFKNVPVPVVVQVIVPFVATPAVVNEPFAQTASEEGPASAVGVGINAF